MKTRKWRFKRLSCILMALSLLLPLSAMAEDVSESYVAQDVSLTPGSDASELNFSWITDDIGTGECVVQIAPEHSKFKHAKKFFGFKTPMHRKDKHPSNIFTANNAQSADGVVDYYYCKITATGLKNHSKYVYRFGDNYGYWSDIYKYSTENKNKYGFIYLADAQIGAGRDDDNDGDGIADTDIEGWTNTIDLIYENFPQAAFIMSAGDQIETPGDENEWNGFFAPFQNQHPFPVAPVSANHDQSMRGNYSEGYIYHFNLPNEGERTVTSVDINNCNTGGGPGGAPPGMTSSDSDSDECTSEYVDIELSGDYYYTYGNVLYMALNMDSTDYEAHRAFMEDAVAANPNVRWKVAMWHYTIYTAASRNAFIDRTEMTTIMEDMGVDVVLMGHDHTYCRTYPMLGDDVQEETFNTQGESVNPTGVVYFTANSSSGSKYYSLDSDIDTGSDKFKHVAVYGQPEVPMFSYIEVDHEHFKVTTFVTDTMDIFDTYTIKKPGKCHKKQSKSHGQR